MESPGGLAKYYEFKYDDDEKTFQILTPFLTNAS